MKLHLEDKLFVVTGATSGFGLAITKALLEEGAHIIINARGEERLQALADQHPDQLEALPGDITTDAILSNLMRLLGKRHLDGIVINAGGPPAKSFINTEMEDWDNAYNSILRWKVKLTQSVLEKLIPQHSGRILYIESASVKQPIENLVLSNSLRLAVVGFVKTLSQEIGQHGITVNVIAPGYHATPAMERLFVNKSVLLGISPAEARNVFEKETKVGHLGNADDLASLAVWLLSSKSGYVTGQTIAIDGGLVSNTL